MNKEVDIIRKSLLMKHVDYVKKELISFFEDDNEYNKVINSIMNVKIKFLKKYNINNENELDISLYRHYNKQVLLEIKKYLNPKDFIILMNNVKIKLETE
jgi:hypothetical protein